MKMLVAGLILLGIVAALSAAVLVAALRAERGQPAVASSRVPTEVEILTATRNFSAGTLIDKSCIATRTVARTTAPANALTSDAQALGHVLITPLVEGQVFKSDCFAPDGSDEFLAAMLARGMRAVEVPLPERSGPDSPFYPGCFVDVSACLRPPTEQAGAGEVICGTLLECVQILPQQKQHAAKTDAVDFKSSAERGRRPTVTLVVKAQQANYLHFALRNGTVRLNLRSPGDTESRSDTSVLRKLIDEFAARPTPEKPPENVPATQSANSPPPGDEVIIIRGGEIEKRMVPKPAPGQAEKVGTP